MRAFTRILAIGILLISCSDSITNLEFDPGDPSGSTCDDPGRVVLDPPSLGLVMGAADRVTVHVGCDYDLPAGTSVGWTVLDQDIASFYPKLSEPIGTRIVQPQAPGRTLVVAEVAGRRDSVSVFVPDTVSMGPVADLGAGGLSSCAVTEGGDAYCWGIAPPLMSSPNDPAVGTCMGTPCSPVPVLRDAGVRQVFAGGHHACSLDELGEAVCWGDNSLGRAGSLRGGMLYNPTPVTGGSAFVVLALGTYHSCGLDPQGKAHCWGSSATGRLGNGQRDEYGTGTPPGPVSGGYSFVSLTAGPDQTCGATPGGHIYCWGILGESQNVVAGAERCPSATGKDGTQYYVGCSYVPLRMPVAEWAAGDTLFVQLSGTCARTASGSVFCFETGVGRYVPKTGLSDIATISAGRRHACGLTEAGSAFCWGENGQGQLGDGTRTDSDAPVSVSGDHTFTQIVAGESHSCGLTTDKEVWCWGSSHYGAAGRSILSSALVPEMVRGQEGS